MTPDEEHQRAARLLFGLLDLAMSGVIAGQTSGFDFLALLRETALSALDSELAALNEDHDEDHEERPDE